MADPTCTLAPPELTNSIADPAATTGGVPEGVVDAPVPTSADRYRLDGEIARGGMGEVYRATDTVLNREVAVKVLQPKYAPDSGTAQRFHDEARITAQLQHPNIPAVHDLGSLPDGRPFLAMKLIKGNTLDDLLKDRKDPSVERGRFVAAFEAICQGVAYAHAHGVIHRDLKPQNVMVGNFGEVQVMDWGLAKVLGTRSLADTDPESTSADTEIKSLRDSEDLLTQAGSVLGTPAYMPPEQALGAVHEIDRRSDVFGLGGILAAILTSKPPFVGDTGETTRVMAAKGKVQDCFARLDASGADPELVTLCKRCLSPEKDGRPADAGAVATAVAALRAAADERARQAEIEREKATVQSAEQRKRRRVQLALAGAVLLLLIGGGAFAWWADANRRDRDAEKQRVANERATDQAVAEATERQSLTSALDQAEAALRAERYSDADAALNQAKQRLPAEGFDDLRERYRSLCNDRELVRKLEGLRLGWLTQAEFQSRGDYSVDNSPVLAIFRNTGWDIDGTTADALGWRVAGSPIRTALVATFGVWAVELRGSGEDERVAKLVAALAVADPHPDRAAIRHAMTNGRLTRAMTDRIRRLNPAEHPPDFLATVYAKAEMSREELRRLQTTAVAVYPGNLRFHLDMVQSGNPNDARGPAQNELWLARVRAAVALRPDSPPLLTSLANGLDVANQLDAAERLARRAVDLAPDYFRGHERLGYIALHRGDADSAAAHFERAARCPDDPVPSFLPGWWGAIGDHFNARRDHGTAARWYQKAVIDRGQGDAYWAKKLDLAMAAAGDPGWAAKWIEAEADCRPDRRSLLLFQLGQMLAASRMPEEKRKGLETLRRLFDADPPETFGLFTLVSLLDADGKRDEATALLRRMADYDHDQVPNRKRFAYIQADVGVQLAERLAAADPTEARRYVDRAVELFPHISGYSANRFMRAASVYARLGDTTAAAALNRQWLDNLPPDARVGTGALSEYCRAMTARKAFAEAVPVLERFLARFPAYAEDPTFGFRYTAACMAVNAGTPELRAKAHTWLTADLADWRELIARKEVRSPQAVEQYYVKALGGEVSRTGDLAAVRDLNKLADLPADERAKWVAYWADVRKLQDSILSEPERFAREADELHFAGRTADAVAAAAEALKVKWVNPDRLYNIACIFSVGSAKIVGKKQENADRAMSLLLDAVKGGWTDHAHMKMDTDLDPLRERDDFKKLLADLEAKFPPKR